MPLPFWLLAPRPSPPLSRYVTPSSQVVIVVGTSTCSLYGTDRLMFKLVPLSLSPHLCHEQSQRVSLALNAEEMSKSIPFLVRPEKLDGSMAGDMGFDPMRL
jgi:hypothetical protein